MIPRLARAQRTSLMTWFEKLKLRILILTVMTAVVCPVFLFWMTFQLLDEEHA